MPETSITKIRALLRQIESVGQDTVSLVPSENLMSKDAASVLSSDLGQRYMFPGGEGTTLYWPGTKLLGTMLAEVENLVQSSFDCRFSSVRPLSGIHCMTIVLSFLRQLGKDTVYFVPPDFGGHGNSPRIAKRFGLNVAYLPMRADTFEVDLHALSRLLPPETDRVAIYIDQWVSLLTPSIAALRNTVGDKCYIHHDTSHIMGLIAGGATQSPLALGANSFGGSTHKTLPGPQKGIILWNDPVLSNRLQDEVSTFVSQAHTGSIAALGVALEEFSSYGSRYAKQVLINAQCFAKEMKERGMHVIGEQVGYTTTHQIVCDLGDTCDLQKLGDDLRKSRISLNFLEPGILGCRHPVRFGVQEVTLRGMREAESKQLARLLSSLFLEGEAKNSLLEEFPGLLRNCRSNAFI